MSDSTSTDHIDVAYVARLARLELTDEERTRFDAQLADILGYVHKITELDTEGVEPMTRAAGMTNVFRADEVRPGLSHDAVIANAPAQRDGQISVPRIIE